MKSISWEKFCLFSLIIIIHFSIHAQTFTEQTEISLPGISRGTTAWGDYDNDGDLDILLVGSGITKIYRNNADNTFTEQTDINLPGVHIASAKWCDYNRDGYLDFVLAGLLEMNEVSKIIRNYGNNRFVEQTNISLTGIIGSVDWGDYNNDGGMDLIITGKPQSGNNITKVYKNNENPDVLGFAEQTSIELMNSQYPSVVWGDFNNDRRMDIFLSGTPESKIYQNRYKPDDNSIFFTEKTIPLSGSVASSMKWGDYDSDGDLDILLTGRNSDETVTQIYKNMGDGSFIEQIGISLIGVSQGDVEWGDYDNDGDLDILLSGYNDLYGGTVKIYRNDGDDNFSEQGDISLYEVYSSSVAWGDYDNDGDLDILLSGYNGTFSVSKVYRNESSISNTPPSIPEQINHDEEDVLFSLISWNKSSDAETPSDALSYNIFIRSDSDTIVMPNADLGNGFLKVPGRGNVPSGNVYGLKTTEYAPGTYYAKVQSIDNGYASSPFSSEYEFNIPAIPFIKYSVDSLVFQEINLSTNEYYAQEILISNTGNSDLIITEMNFDNNAFTTDLTFPLSIAPGKTDTIKVNFSPNYDGVSYGIATIVSNSYSSGNLQINLTGYGMKTKICGIMNTDIIWTKENSPYYITCNSTISEGNTLTAEPGVKIFIAEGVSFYVDGNLNFNGSKEDSIIIQKPGTVKFSQFKVGGEGKIAANYLKVSGADTAFNFTNTTQFISIRNSVIKNCKSAIVQQEECSSDMELYNVTLCNITSHGYANYSDNISSSFEISKCNFYNNTGTPIYLRSKINLNKCLIDSCNFTSNNRAIFLSMIGNLTISNSIISNNKYGIYLGASNKNIIIEGNLITESEYYGISSSQLFPIVIQHNTISNNADGITTKGAEKIIYNNIFGNTRGLKLTTKKAIANYNTFHNNIYFNIIVNLYGTGELDARYNTFEGLDETQIGSSIYDYYDNSNLFKANYSGYGLPAPPSDFKGETHDNTQINLSWRDNSNNETNYNLYRSVNNKSSFELISYLPANSNSYSDNTVQFGNTYYYKLNALNDKGTLEIDTVKVINSYFSEIDHNIKAVMQGDATWADYDNDGDLDVLITGSGNDDFITRIYRNDGGNFVEQKSIPLIGLNFSAVAWGDYDNDGDLDILITGNSESLFVKIYKNEGNNSFIEQTDINLTVITRGSIDWGDYDNDGDLDILMTGQNDNETTTRASRVYRNDGNNLFTEQTSIVLKKVYLGSGSWGDYDNDGDLDILLTGSGVNLKDFVSEIYTNNGDNTFTKQTDIGLTGVYESSAAWGDYDNDGDLDILLMGKDYNDNAISKLYKNNGDNTFSEQTDISFGGFAKGALSWSDFDGDGDLDIIMNGSNKSKVYRNNGDNSFTELLNDPLIHGVDASSVACGDFNNDGLLDILETGNSPNGLSTKLYRNNRIKIDTTTIIPTNLRAEYYPASARVEFNWDALGVDGEQVLGRTYNLRIGTAPGLSNVRSGEALSNGTRLVPKRGMIQSTNYFLNLRPGKYYWSVQSINNSFKGSPFSEEKELIIDCGGTTPEVNDIELCHNQQPILVENPNINWYNSENNQKPVQKGNVLNYNLDVGNHTYYLTQTNNGCESWHTPLKINIKESPEDIEISTSVASSCISSDGSIIISSNYNSIQYSIDEGKTFQLNNEFTNLIAGNYNMLIQLDNSCLTSHEINLNPSNYNIEKPVIQNVEVCYGNSSGFTASSTNVEWYNAEFNYLSKGSIYVPDNIEPGIYNYYAINTDGNCQSDFTSLEYVIHELPNVAIEQGNELEKCKYDTLAVNIITLVNDVVWKPTEGLSDALSFEPAIYSISDREYTVKATDDNGCSNQVNLKIKVKPAPDKPEIAGKAQVCYNESDLLYSIQHSSENLINRNIQGGTLSELNKDSVYVTWDQFNSEAALSIYLTNPENNCNSPLEVFPVTKNGTAFDKMEVKLKGDYILYVLNDGLYQWFFNDSLIEGATQKWLKADKYSDKNYSCLVTTKVGECQTMSNPYNFNFKSSSKNMEMSLFPNPTNGSLTLKVNGDKDLNKGILQIFDLKGNIMRSIELEQKNIEKNIDVSNFKNGVYTWRLIINNDIKTGRFVKVDQPD